MKQARRILKQCFGYDEFWPMQAKVIETVLSRQDSLVLMPTGGGKSICYQVPALLLPGVTVVVSPLISLMRDQVGALRLNGVRAAFLNSSLSTQDASKVVRLLESDGLKLLYVAPERLMMAGFLEILKQVNVSLMAVDEAHCISVWGHSFRKEYAQLGKLRQLFPKVPMMALTATADEVTRNDIVKQLRMKKVKKFIDSFDRPSIKMSVWPANSRAKMIVSLVQARQNEAGIVYCLSRKGTEGMAKRLKKVGVKADYYHAGVEPKKRAQVQEAFLRDELQVICATVAFGMGIDKSNVRFVIHHNMPPNVESYYQEIGRAGRDGLASEAILFYSVADVMQWRRMILNDELGEQQEEVKLEKLYKMQKWVELMTCRRKFILNYFGEEASQICAGCDMCLQPPDDFDGTEVVQKVLSVLARVKNPLSTMAIVGILRGSKAMYILDKGYDRIKTYGTGENIGASAWRQYIGQMMQLRLLSYATRGRGLEMTKMGERVLFEREKVELKKSPLEMSGAKKVRRAVVLDDVDYDKELFENLRKLRGKLANKQGVPAYIVFSDATLRQMVVIRPKTKSEMLSVSGVGEVKWERYGEEFLKVIGDDAD